MVQIVKIHFQNGGFFILCFIYYTIHSEADTQLIYCVFINYVIPYTVTPCTSNPCLNSGRCVNTGDTYSCICKPGFSGRDCHCKIRAIIVICKPIIHVTFIQVNMRRIESVHIRNVDSHNNGIIFSLSF